MADQNSIFYKIGQATKTNVANAISGLLADNNTWTGTNDFNEAVTVGTDGKAADLTVKGGVSSTGAVSGNTVSATGAVSGGSVTATGAVSGASLTTTGNATIGGKATINGDLVVKGTTTTLSTSTLEVDDNFIHLSKGANDGAYTKDSGLYFERASGSAATAFIWDEDKGRFVLGALDSTGSTKEITFSEVSAQIGTAAEGATVGVSISGDLNYSNSSDYGSPGTVTTPDKFYLLPIVDGQTVQVGSGGEQLGQGIKDMGSGFYIIATMNQSNGNMLSEYSVLVYVASGDTLANVTKLHLWDGAVGSFVNDQGEMYNATSFANGETYDFTGGPTTNLTHTNGYYSSGTGIFTFSISDTSLSLGASANTDISTGAYPKTASIVSSGSVTYAAGTYDVTLTLKGQLASNVTSFQISATSGGSTVTDYNGNITPFALNTDVISYIADADSPYTTFQQLAIDASKLQYSSTESHASFNGGYFMASSTDGLLLEVSFNTTPGENDYIGLAHGSSVVMPVPASADASGPDADTAEVTPGKFLAGQVEIVDASDGVVALGDLADFNAGLSS